MAGYGYPGYGMPGGGYDPYAAAAYGADPYAAYGGSTDPRERTVYVGNVAANMDDNMIRALFSNCGVVTNIRIAGRVPAARPQ